MLHHLIYLIQLVAVTPSKIFNSVAVAVTPSNIFNSAVVAVTPSKIFNSAAVDVTDKSLNVDVTAVEKLNVPLPSVTKTCPDVPSAVGKVNVVPLFNLDIYNVFDILD